MKNIEEGVMEELLSLVKKVCKNKARVQMEIWEGYGIH